MTSLAPTSRLNLDAPPDYHHHSIFPTTQPIEELMPRILALWENKGIRPKFHLSEPRKGAVTPMVRSTVWPDRPLVRISADPRSGSDRNAALTPTAAKACRRLFRTISVRSRHDSGLPHADSPLTRALFRSHDRGQGQGAGRVSSVSDLRPRADDPR